MEMRKLYILYILVILIISSCFKPNLSFTNSGKLSFSVDTLTFDTIFTNIGSTTRKFKVYNRNSQTIKINEIRLASNNSNFKLNIDGLPQSSVNNYELAGGDSLYIFVSVKIDPGRDKMLLHDSVIFDVDAGLQDLDLVAFGQDVHLINGNDSSGYLKTQSWTADKPYLVYNSMLVEADEVLTIEEGTKIYFHDHSRLYVLGSLVVNGTAENPVLFTGDRLEDWYDDAPGQWSGISLLAGSKDNIISWAEIKNGITGLVVDTFANSKPTLTILNTKIENMNSIGLLAEGSRIFAANCLFANCGQVAVALVIGGEYEFYHCTIANYWGYNPRNTPALFMQNYYKDTIGNYYVRNIEKAYFGNCIIYGGASSEFYADSFPNLGYINYQFDHSLLRVDENVDTTNGKFKNCIFNPSNLDFKDIDKNNYELDTLSPAKDAADINITNLFPQVLDTDLNNKSRVGDKAPDIGAYERIEGK